MPEYKVFGTTPDGKTFSSFTEAETKSEAIEKTDEKLPDDYDPEKAQVRC